MNGAQEIHREVCLKEYRYESQSKIFRTGAAIYTAVVVARGTGKW
jgi:hypothetical protein